MAKKPSTKNTCPYLEWPEESPPGEERDIFYAEMLNLLGPAEWVAVVPTPAPWPDVRKRIAADCHHVLQEMERPPRGIAWLCLWADMPKALPGLFEARLPQLAFCAFDKRPDLGGVNDSVRSPDGSPAQRFLFFDDGLLWRTGQL